MIDPVFTWLESSAFSIWMRESPSMFAFPGILAAHTVGLAFVAGLNGALDLRVLGVARSISPASFGRFLPFMWFGLWVNVLSGVALLAAYPTKALTNPVFYLKLGAIAAALLMLGPILRKAQVPGPRGSTIKLLAAASLAAWATAIVAGRLLAYTCIRLTVDSRC
jgi:hypothetical protein